MINLSINCNNSIRDDSDKWESFELKVTRVSEFFKRALDMAALPKLRSSTHGGSTDKTTSTETATEGEVVGADLDISESKRETYDFNMFM